MKRVVVLGDPICTGYFPVLAAALKKETELWLAPMVMNTTVDLLVGVKEWVLKRQPEVVVLASGILDTRRICFGENERVMPLPGFARNVRCILESILENGPVTPVWMTMAAVDTRKVKDAEDFGYDNETISLYNEDAKAVARSLGVPVVDVYGIIKAASRADSNRLDGVKFDQRSSDYLASEVAVKLRKICETL